MKDKSKLGGLNRTKTRVLWFYYFILIQFLHSKCTIRGMQSSGHILFASFNPIHSIILKKHGRLSERSIFGARSRRLYAYHQKHHHHTKPVMVVQPYVPPWFSVAPMMESTDNHYRSLACLISKHA